MSQQRKASLMWVFIIIMSVTVALLCPAMGSTQQKARDRVGELEERLRRLEAEAAPVRVESEVHAVGEIAKMTLESYDRNFGIITYVAAAVSVVIALFAWFGFTEYKQVVRPLKPLKGRQEQLIDQVRAESSKLAELGSALHAQKVDLDRYREAMVRDIVALIRTVSAFTYTQSDNPDLHRGGLRELVKALDEGLGPHHPQVESWAYSLRGYLTRRVSYSPAALLEALDYARRATAADPENETAHFNAACYACCVGRTAEWVNFLARAIELNPAFRAAARGDADFATVRETPDFQRLTAGD